MDPVKLRDSIESLSKENHIEIGRILYSNGIFMNENQNGIFVNISTVDPKVIEKVQQYVEYVELQEKQLVLGETAKEGLNQLFFTKPA